MSISALRVFAGRRAGVAAVGAVVAAGLAVTTLSAGPASAATSPRPAPGLVAGVSAAPDDTMKLFYQVAGHTLVVRQADRTAVFGGAQSLGGHLTSGPAANTVASTPALDYVFARGTDNAIWYRFSSVPGVWRPWASMGGRALGAPTSSGVGTSAAVPNVWVRGTDGALWHSFANIGRWFSLGGRLLSDPSAVPVIAGSPSTGSDVFALGTDHAVWEFTSGWHRVGGRSTVAPAAVPGPFGWTTLFARGTDNALWMTARAPGAARFGPWRRIGGILTSAPVATIFPNNEPGAIRVFALGTDGNLWQASRQVRSNGPFTWQQVH
jgi:hypothetical protein